jgi:hypothetical protein
MNERRIEELAKQARAWAETAFKHQHEKFTSHWDNPVGYTVTQFFEQKFAELIVRECANIVSNKSTLETNEDYREGFHRAQQFIWQDINKHFGVEE